MQELQYTEVRNYIITENTICTNLLQRITPLCNKILISSKFVSEIKKKQKLKK